MNIQRQCKECDETLSIPAESNKVTCQCCGTEYTVSWDGEFVDGSWKDRTALHKVDDGQYEIKPRDRQEGDEK